jgi:hypothetical protein
MNMSMDSQENRKVYWHAGVSSGGTLSLSVDMTGQFTKEEKETEIAHGIQKCYEQMEQDGLIPFRARTMSSRDIAREYGKSRQYWEKLLSEGKIRYRETSAGRITTDLWIQGYLDDKPNVDKYVRNVREVLATIEQSKKKHAQSSALCATTSDSNSISIQSKQMVSAATAAFIFTPPMNDGAYQNLEFSGKTGHSHV